ncbi:Ger(x)C family spore germination protein [Paenibacillus albicereus]|uniref:Ger(X)C family spore germination protein n=1 Tax=Paenibacillus albicereus TaxID=2726185 RepID=A0A6H2GVA2_9BACL|nr:Ger(x)C family spore germination protein [Paenibacillus albicereus]QJC51078.1 Ger(x)C family spore germination protein [Paenibacillus albicereus]
MGKRICVVLACLLLLSGCWSRRELNDLLVVLGMGIDWEDGQYVVSFQVVNPNEISLKSKSTNRAPGTLYQGRGNTIFEAARSLTTRAPRLMYLGHLQLFVLSEEMARRGVASVIDSPLRDNEARMDYNVVIARGATAEQILELYTPLERLPTYSMQQSLRTSERSWAPTVAVTMGDVVNKLTGDGQQLVLTGIEIVGSRKQADRPGNLIGFRPAASYNYRGIGAFKGDKLIGWLDEKESKGFTDLTDNLDSTSIELPCSKTLHTGIEVTSSDTKIVPRIRGGKAEFLIQIWAQGDIVENACPQVDFSRSSTFDELEKRAEDIVRSNAEAAIRWGKRHEADLFGFGSALGRKHPEYWKQAKATWDVAGFPQANISFQIDLVIRKTGSIGNSVKPKP